MKKPYTFSLYEESDYKGVVHFAIDIAPALGNSGVWSKKPYEDGGSYRRDLEQDFMYTASNGTRSPKEVAMLSDERAKYYGWAVTLPT